MPSAKPARANARPAPGHLWRCLWRWLWPRRRWLGGVGLALLLLPYVGLAFFNQPYWDDYGVALLARRLGLGPAQAYSYAHWTGRYFATLLQTAANPLTYGWVAGIRAVPLLALATTGLAQAWALRALLGERLGWRSAGGVGAGLLLAMLYTMPSPNSGFYWFISVVVYQVGAVLFLGLAVALVQSGQASRRAARRAWYGLAVACVAALAGINEVTLLLTGWLLACLSWLSYRRANRRALRRWLGLLVVLLLGAAVLLAAPGNFVRLAQDAPPTPPGLWRVAARAVAQTIMFLTEPRQLTALVVLPVLLARLGYRCLPGRPAGLRLPLAQGLGIVLGGILLAMLLLSRVGWGYPAVRVLNLLWFWLLMGSLLAAWAALPAGAPRRPGPGLRRLHRPAWLYVALLALGGPERAAWRELFENAPAWQRQQAARTATIERARQAGARQLSVEPLAGIRPHNVLIIGETLSPAASAPANQDAAAWYGLDSLRLRRPGLAPADVQAQ